MNREFDLQVASAVSFVTITAHGAARSSTLQSCATAPLEDEAGRVRSLCRDAIYAVNAGALESGRKGATKPDFLVFAPSKGESATYVGALASAVLRKSGNKSEKSLQSSYSGLQSII
jgi:hypothetical protein